MWIQKNRHILSTVFFQLLNNEMILKSFAGLPIAENKIHLNMGRKRTRNIIFRFNYNFLYISLQYKLVTILLHNGHLLTSSLNDRTWDQTPHNPL